MLKLELVGWCSGLKTVSLIQAVRFYSRSSLSDAKHQVERLLEGQTIVLEFAQEEKMRAFSEIAKDLGVEIR